MSRPFAYLMRLLAALLPAVLLGTVFAVLALPAAAAPTAPSQLPAVSVRTAGHLLDSPSGQYSLWLQSDGNLVEYGNGSWIWSSGTAGRGGTTLIVQADGNVVLYGSNGPVWWTATSGAGNSLVLQDDGNLVLYAGAGGARWSGGRERTNVLYPGGALDTGHYIRSLDGRTTFILQADGNIVVYVDGHAAWSYVGNSVVQVALQADGAMMFYSGAARYQFPFLSPDVRSRGMVMQVENAGWARFIRPDGKIWTALPYSAAAMHSTWGGVMTAGRVLEVGEAVWSPDGRTSLTVNPIEQIVLQTAGSRWLATWFSSGYPMSESPSVLRMQADGNLVLYGARGPLWWSGTFGAGNVALVQDDGNFVIYSPTAGAVWNACALTTGLCAT